MHRRWEHCASCQATQKALALLLVLSAPAAAQRSLAPADLAALSLWLDGADSTTLFQDPGLSVAAASGDGLGGWADKSPSGIHALQVEPGERPSVYSGPGAPGTSIRFAPGIQDAKQAARNPRWLALPGFEGKLSQPAWTAFLATKSDPGLSKGTILMVRTEDGKSRRGFRNTAKCALPPCHEFKNRLKASLDIRSDQSVAAEWEVREVVRDGDTVRMLVGGVEVAAGEIGEGDDLDWAYATLGGRHHDSRGADELYQGRVGEVIFYDRALSEEERAAVRSYLEAKWPARGGTREVPALDGGLSEP